jgi:hypothetical protein
LFLKCSLLWKMPDLFPGLSRSIFRLSRRQTWVCDLWNASDITRCEMFYVLRSVSKYEATVAVELFLLKQDIVFTGGMKHLLCLSPVNMATSRLISMTEGGQTNEVSKLHTTKNGRLKSPNVRIKLPCVVRSSRVEAGSNASTLALRVVGGDEKGSLESETVKYGHESHGTPTQKWLRRWGSATIVNDRPFL